MFKIITNKKFIFAAVVILVATISICFFCLVQHKDHVSINALFDKDFVRIAHKNERNLYNNREKYDPSFARGCIIPTSDLAIDIVIPLIEKDLEIIGYTIKAIRKLVGHKIGVIYLISPESNKIRSFANDNDCHFILEDTLIPNKEIKKYGGWIIQQFLKLNADQIVKNDHYLVVDADTIFIRPVVFEQDGFYLVNTHWDCAPNRKKVTADLLGNTKIFQYTFVCHNMLFSKKILQEMKKHIEKRSQKKWDEAMIDIISKGSDYSYGFAEYELYMTYLTEFSKAKFKFVSNANITVYRDFADRLDQIIPAYSHQYKSISLHHFVLFNKK